MAIDLSGYYGSVADISENIEEGMSGIGIGVGHGIDKIRKRRAESKARGIAPGMLGYGIAGKLFGQSEREFEAPLTQSEYEVDKADDGPSYEEYLTGKYGGTWETRDGMGYRQEGAKAGGRLLGEGYKGPRPFENMYGLTGGMIPQEEVGGFTPPDKEG